ncbi:MAG: hypothetical protein K9H48_17540 [Melioribacteraceae bacterium]|nr:hypothetical protein [Melioribacteraceae bacterium]MCF8395707.1 hypothetical protein [Melioribacteraceae bacterium]MCF8421222.1 hypothetical protein [Melioribacteraceae bacterium]
MSLTIGCDPELVCRINGRFVHAHHYFKQNSSFGLDGNNSICELRPGYSESPIDLTAKVRCILEYGHDKHPDIELYSGHFVDDYPIGGHIHLSVAPSPSLIDSLDTVLYSFSNVIDDKSQRQKRERTGYGKRKAYRTKSYGLEYRTPGSWLLSPTTTLIIFTLAKLTALGVTEDNIDFTSVKAAQHSITFLRNFAAHLNTIPDDCKEGLTELNLLLNMDTINWNENILPNWGIYKEAA